MSQINPVHAPILFLIILFNTTPNFACPLLMIYHQSFQENFRILPTPAHCRFLPDPFPVIAPFHVECCWVTGICREITHTKAFGGVQLWLKSFWSWVRYRLSGQLHVPAILSPEKNRRYPFIGDWVGPRVGRAVLEHRDTYYRDSNPGPPVTTTQLSPSHNAPAILLALCLRLIKPYAWKRRDKVQFQFLPLLSWPLDRGRWLAFCCDSFTGTSEEQAVGTCWMGGCMAAVPVRM